MTIDYLYKKFQSSTNDQGQLLNITEHLIVRNNILGGGRSQEDSGSTGPTPFLPETHYISLAKTKSGRGRR
jgi:hypothetical protein